MPKLEDLTPYLKAKKTEMMKLETKMRKENSKLFCLGVFGNICSGYLPKNHKKISSDLFSK